MEENSTKPVPLPQEKSHNEEENKQEEYKREPVKTYVPPVPFLQRLHQHNEDKNFLKFLDVFKKFHIIIPFA